MIPTTFICTAANKATVEATGLAIFGLPLSPTGVAPATHFACSGLASANDISALTPYCSTVIQNDSTPFVTIASAGLMEVPINPTN